MEGYVMQHAERADVRLEYEDYQETSRNYDRTRVPIGAQIILGALASGPNPLPEQTVLDAGCGTGNYIDALRRHVGRLCGLELSEGMLAWACRKFDGDRSVRLDHGSVLELPYQHDMFDGMMCNQVIHHLGSDGADRDDFPEVRRLLSEAYRVLKPGAMFVISTSSHRQLRDGFWWADLIPAAVTRITQRYPSLPRLSSMLAEAGFAFEESIVPLNAVLQGTGYLDPKGPLSKAHRDGDSTWSLASEEELHRALDRLLKMNEDGSIADYLEGRERLRRDVGQTTFLVARRGGP